MRSKTARKLLPTLPIAGRVCTFDALHCHRQLWRLLRSQQAYPLFVIKGNEPTLQTDLATYFADPHAEVQQAQTLDRQRGRLESRAIKVSRELCSSLQADWPGISHVAQLTRTRTEKGEITIEIVYLISILPPGPDAPLHLLELSLGHWGIENSLHSVRDVTFAEDRSRIRTGHAPQLLAACRNLALTLIHRSGSSHIAASRRSFSYCDARYYRKPKARPVTSLTCKRLRAWRRAWNARLATLKKASPSSLAAGASHETTTGKSQLPQPPFYSSRVQFGWQLDTEMHHD
jgi:predicted transposase YbfD/YdcC